MAFEAATIFELVVLLTWQCLCVPATGKNPYFAHVFFDEDILYDIASAASLTFCPGLSEVINGSTPPTIAFFKSLPKRVLGLWGIYVLVLEKVGHDTLVYLGSATRKDDSLVSRFRTYDRANLKEKAIPSKVKEALEDGYKIVSKGVLVSAPTPSAKDVPRFRFLFFALEAMFSFLFWTMYSKTKDYQIGSCCPWPRESFTYGGLCSHSPLDDFFKGHIELTAEELELLDVQNEENKKIQAKKSIERRLAKDPEYYTRKRKKAYTEDPQKFRDRSNQAYVELKKDPVKHSRTKAKAKDTRANNKRSKRYWCGDCKYAAETQQKLTRHNANPSHKRCVEMRAAGLDPFYCKPCGFRCKNCLGWASHVKGELHKEKLDANRQPVEAQLPEWIIKSRAKEKAKVKAKASNLYCSTCDLPFQSPKTFENHNKSAKHQMRVSKLPARDSAKRHGNAGGASA